MKIVAARLRTLRESLNVSQIKMAPLIGVKQSSVNRYENDQADPSLETLLNYADYFDVSLDYILGRTDNPQGRLFANQPKVEKANPELQRFVDMCFDPKSPLNGKLRQTLLDMLEEADS